MSETNQCNSLPLGGRVQHKENLLDLVARKRGEDREAEYQAWLQENAEAIEYLQADTRREGRTVTVTVEGMAPEVVQLEELWHASAFLQVAVDVKYFAALSYPPPEENQSPAAESSRPSSS